MAFFLIVPRAAQPVLHQIFTIIAPVLAMAAIGFAWVRLRMPFDNNTITDIILNVGSPCLLFSTLLTRRPEPGALAEIAVVGLSMLACVGIVAAIGLKLARMDLRTYWPALVFPNSGNMGLPLCLLAFGETGLSLAIAFFCAMTIVQFTVGQGVASGHMHPMILLRNPILWSIAVALTLLFADVTPPEWIMNTTDTLGHMVIPLMLMSLGTSLARLRIVTFTRSLVLSLLRLGLGFGVALGLVTAFGLEGPVRGVVLIQSSMPTAVFSYLFALRYGGKHEEVGAMVVLSTLAAFILLPVLMGFVLHG
ncbi:MAG: AEC family transporter [Proteobacteria bacterium]|nr:AEC family transporter [Pseudomonadota bacterium]